MDWANVVTCPSFIGAGNAGLCRMVTHYCERPSSVSDLLAEPFNAASNLAFFIAALAVWLLIRRTPRESRRTYWVFPPLLVLVGLGSLLFHTVATRWAEWVDVFFILAFMLVYLWVALRQLLRWHAIPALGALVLLVVATSYLENDVSGDVLWGGALYLPTILVLGGITASLFVQRSPAAMPMLVAVFVFFASFAARTLDHEACSHFPAGTHFIWHLLNGTFLFLLVRALVRRPPPTPDGVVPSI